MQKKEIFPKSLVVLLLGICLITSGCAAMVAGAGATASAYSYVKGELSRNYQAPYDKVLAASKATLEKLKIRILEEVSDGINTKITAHRADGTPVTINIEMLSTNLTKVGVRCGVLGWWDRKVSQLIHDHIAKRI